MSERFQALPGLSGFAVGKDTATVYSHFSRSTRVISREQMRLLQACPNIATLEEHASRVCKQLKMAPHGIPVIRQQLIELREAGLLVPEAFMIDLCRKIMSDDPAPPGIATIGFPTRNRPEALKRCIDSYAKCARSYDRDIRFTVCDQSDQPEMREANRQALSDSKLQFGIDGRYIETCDLEAFVEKLAGQYQISPHILNFALLNKSNYPVALGANRNALLLATIDELTVQVDDDSLCRVCATPEARDGLTLTSRGDPTEFWFLDSSEAEAVRFEERDFYAIHEELLGKSISSSLAEYGQTDVNLDQPGYGFYRRLEIGTGKASVAMLGVVGDSGMESSQFFLRLDGKSRSRLLESESIYNHALSNHQVLRAVSNRTISDGFYCLGVNLGLDNRQMLPPFMPVLRNSDGIFAATLRLCGDAGYLAYLPWALSHARQQPRSFRKDDLLNDAATVRGCDIIHAIVMSFSPSPDVGNAPRNLVALGQSLVEWGSVPLDDFDEMVRLVLLNRASIIFSDLETRLKSYKDLPEYWAADATAYLAAFEESVPTPQYIIGQDLRSMFGDEAARISLQQLVHQLGELLIAWPDLRRAARNLLSGGYQLGQQV